MSGLVCGWVGRLVGDPVDVLVSWWVGRQVSTGG